MKNQLRVASLLGSLDLFSTFNFDSSSHPILSYLNSQFSIPSAMERRVRRKVQQSDPLPPNIKRQQQQSDTLTQAGQVSTLGNGTKINLVVGYATELTYSVPIQIGGDSFNVQVDTGSGDLVSTDRDYRNGMTEERERSCSKSGIRVIF